MTLNQLIQELEAARSEHGGDIRVLIATSDDPNGCEYFAPEVVGVDQDICDYPDHSDCEVIYEGTHVIVCP